ncbi:MAG: ATP-dependent RecD-like DNA helicase [Oscillospiraceae bacterium]
MDVEAPRLEGKVDSVVYRNEENGYTVLRLLAEGLDEPATVVGCMPGVSVGETLTVTGLWGHHATYGAQFKAKTVEHSLPQGADAILEYLSSGAVKGIGPATARILVEAFGDKTLEVLEEHPQHLHAIKGISPKRAKAIGEAFREQMGMRRLLDFLRRHELSAELALPLYRLYGLDALERVKDEPYLLTQPGLDVVFQTADALAVELGVEAADPQRLEAGLLFELRHNAGNGHTFLPVDKLLPATTRLLNLESPEALLGSLEELVRRGQVVRETVRGRDSAYLAELHTAETYVAVRLEEMARLELPVPPGFDKVVARIQAEQGIEYAPLQLEAMELAAKRQVMLLTGGPGTGKTTSLRGALALFESMGLETALAAPTGRAAKRLGETCGQEAYTIHRLLETHFDDATGQLVFTHDQSDPLKADAVIVDETSMVDIPLMAALLAGLRSDCRLVLVGDPNQLPSVGPGCLLADLLKSGVIPAVSLIEIFRQAAMSAIVRFAHEINHGIVPQLRSFDGDFFFLKRYHPQKAVETIVELVKTRLPGKMGIPSNQVQVLSPTRRGLTGTVNLNKELQAALNPPAPGRPEKVFGSVTFRLGDRVMQVKNNYDVMWLDPGKGESGLGIFNGDIGEIVNVEPDGAALTVDFDGKQVLYTPEALGELELAYAVTVHKSQGSEYPAVALACLEAAPMLLTRSVLYTGVTRARQLFIGVGDERVFARMVENNKPQRRYSALAERLTGA